MLIANVGESATEYVRPPLGGPGALIADAQGSEFAIPRYVPIMADEHVMQAAQQTGVSNIDRGSLTRPAVVTATSIRRRPGEWRLRVQPAFRNARLVNQYFEYLIT